MPPRTSGLLVDFASGLMRSTSALPASMSTPASLYVIATPRACTMPRRVGAAPVIDVVVPARDHAASLGPLLRDLPQRTLRSVVVVDRASNDRTAEIARDHGALVLREPTGGYGAACLRAQAHFSSLPRVPD